MVVEYKEVNFDFFLLIDFVEIIYQMCFNDEINILLEWKKEFYIMEKYKMVLCC